MESGAVSLFAAATLRADATEPVRTVDSATEEFTDRDADMETVMRDMGPVAVMWSVPATAEVSSPPVPRAEVTPSEPATVAVTGRASEMVAWSASDGLTVDVRAVVSMAAADTDRLGAIELESATRWMMELDTDSDPLTADVSATASDDAAATLRLGARALDIVTLALLVTATLRLGESAVTRVAAFAAAQVTASDPAMAAVTLLCSALAADTFREDTTEAVRTVVSLAAAVTLRLALMAVVRPALADPREAVMLSDGLTDAVRSFVALSAVVTTR